jgi:hypothetical protein
MDFIIFILRHHVFSNTKAQHWSLRVRGGTSTATHALITQWGISNSKSVFFFFFLSIKYAIPGSRDEIFFSLSLVHSRSICLKKKTRTGFPPTGRMNWMFFSSFFFMAVASNLSIYAILTF